MEIFVANSGIERFFLCRYEVQNRTMKAIQTQALMNKLLHDVAEAMRSADDAVAMANGLASLAYGK